ncbi:MAG: hypothetical protein BroJett030_08360 [Alphaproteobacteria bacterium]|nr:MAG: hypothetical protein BroJett030_08360 [Alphaproteobacteria bacterium]
MTAMAKRSGWLAITVWLFVASCGPAVAEGRVALVIGNAAYRNVPPLANPANDAADMAVKLAGMGFEVTSGTDLDLDALRRTVRDFIGKLAGADLAVFYYAGHGLQVNGENYIAPIDARLNSHDDLPFEAIPVDLVLSAMERNTRTNLVFLDACRDNPLADNLARSMGSRSSAVGRGLARIGSGVGSLIAFATQPGNIALDGEGRNSPFTAGLLKHLGTPGQSVTDDLILVRNAVLATTGGKQVPWDNSSLTGRVVLVPSAGTREGDPSEPALTRDATQIELAFWNSVKDAREPGYFEAYLARWPEGTFADLARLKLAAVEDADASAAAREPERVTRLDVLPADVPDQTARSADLARSVQTELNRVGCSVGRVDGVWGPASRRALEEFARRQGTRLASLDPDERMLNQLKAVSARVCPLVCGTGTQERDGRCEPVTQQTRLEPPAAQPERKTPEAAREPAANPGLAGSWSLTASCSWGSGTYPVTVTADNRITGSINGAIRSGQISGKSVSFTTSNALNTARYVGTIVGNNAMRGTMTQNLSTETCTWSASR